MDDGRPASPAWAGLRSRLLALKRPIFDEIRNYSPQVAGCDLHFKDWPKSVTPSAAVEASAFLKGGGTT